MHLPRLLIFVIFGALAAHLYGADAEYKRPVLLGATTDMYVIGGMDGPKPGTFDEIVWIESNSGPDSHVSHVLLPDVTAASPTRPRMSRWRIKDDFLWYVAVGHLGSSVESWFKLRRVPLDQIVRCREGEQQTLDLSDIEKDKDKHRWGPILEKRRDGKANDGSAGSYVDVAAVTVPLRDAFLAMRDKAVVYFDIWPSGDHSCLLFALHEPSERATGFHVASTRAYLQVTRYTFGAVSGTRVTEWQGTWEVVENIESDFNEPFFAVPVGGEMFFITASGAVFGTKRDADSGWRKTALRRDGGPVRIVTLLANKTLTEVRAFTETCTFAIGPELREEPFSFRLWGDWGNEFPIAAIRRCADWTRRQSSLDGK